MENENTGSKNEITVDDVMERTFAVYKRCDENEEFGLFNWVRTSKRGIEVIDGGYAQLLSLEGKHYVVSNGGDFPKDTVREITQNSVDKYLARYPDSGVDGNGTFCVSSFGPALSVLSVAEPVDAEISASILEYITMEAKED
jgi:hypothetical protein